MSIALAQFSKIKFFAPIEAMQTVSETRRQRLAILVKEAGSSLAALNEKLGLDRTDATLSQIRTSAKHSKTGKPRSMGDELARKIEERMNLPQGWMDTPPSHAYLHDGNDPMAKAVAVMEHMPDYQWPKVLQMLDIFVQPEQKNGTNAGK